MSPTAPASLADGALRRDGIGELVARSANALNAQGLMRGQRVALLSHNNDLYVILYFALARLSAISVPVNFMLPLTRRRPILNSSP